jgi:hypothetical protein
MSRSMVEAPITRPSSSMIGETVTEMFTRLPSLRTRTVSSWRTCSPRRMRSMISSGSRRRSGGTIRLMGRPTAPSSVQPKILSAPRFQVVITLFRSFDRIASLELSTMAARRACSRRARSRSVRSVTRVKAPRTLPSSSRCGTRTTET